MTFKVNFKIVYFMNFIKGYLKKKNRSSEMSTYSGSCVMPSQREIDILRVVSIVYSYHFIVVGIQIFQEFQ